MPYLMFAMANTAYPNAQREASLTMAVSLAAYTVGPPNNGHLGPRLLSFVEKLSPFVLCRERGCPLLV